MIESKYEFLGVGLPDGTVRVEGPLDERIVPQKVAHIVDHEQRPVTRTKASNVGEAILNILGGVLIKEKSR